MRLVTRLLQGILVVFIAASAAFLLLKTVKGDQFTVLSENPEVGAITLQRARAFNEKPLHTQYLYWMSSVMRGDLLTSYSNRDQPVLQVIAEALPKTLLLMSLAFFSSIVGGIALGAWQGAHVGSRTERISHGFSQLVLSIPDFWLAILLLIIFVLQLHWFPSQGMSSDYAPTKLIGNLLDRAWHLFLPWLSLTLVNVAIFARFQRSAMRDVIGQNFVRTAHAKGVPDRDVTLKHALRVAVVPVITIAGMYFPALLVGAILVEKVFHLPGMGYLLAEAVTHRDYFLVTGIVIVGSAMTALGSFLADVAREYADPRLRA